MIGAGFDALLGRLFDDNPWALQRLAPHHGKRIRFAAGGFAAVFVIDRERGLARAPTGDDSADLSVALKLPPALPPGIDTLLRAAQIEGPADVAESLSFVLRNLRVDPADWLAPLIGDAAAERLTRAAAAALRAGRQSGERLAGNLREYLVFEDRVLVDASAASRFADEVRALADAAAALERRIGTLQRRTR